MWFTTRGLHLPKAVQTIIDANNSISQESNLSIKIKKDIPDGSASQALIKAAGSVYDASNNSISQKSNLSTKIETGVMDNTAFYKKSGHVCCLSLNIYIDVDEAKTGSGSLTMMCL